MFALHGDAHDFSPGNLALLGEEPDFLVLGCFYMVDFLSTNGGLFFLRIPGVVDAMPLC